MLVQEDDSALIAMALSKSLFTAAEADEARRAAEQSGRPVSEVLVERGLLAARTIDSLRTEVARASGTGVNDLTTATPPDAPRGGKLPVPCRLGDYEIVQKLGEGGMGAVYRARQTSLDREVALKVLTPQVMQEPEYLERFEREARAMAKINDPHVITVYDTRSVEGRLVMSLELMRGGDAAQLAQKSGGRLAEARALAIARDCARGLQALEKAGLVHRDIKPANVFIGDEGQAKLADLGLARMDTGDDRMTKSGMVVGTPAFMAPEQADGRTDLDVRTDVYAVGATLFQLVTGSPPYTGSSGLVVISKVLTAPVPDPRALRPDVSTLTAELIMKALAKDRGERFQTATELVVAVERARVALGGGRASGRIAPQPQPQPQPARPSGRVIAQKSAVARAGAVQRADGPHPAVVGLVGALLVGFVIAAVAMLGGKGDGAQVAAVAQPSGATLTPDPEPESAVRAEPEPESVVRADPEPESAVRAEPEPEVRAEPESAVRPEPEEPEPVAPLEPEPAAPKPEPAASPTPIPAPPPPAPPELPRGVSIPFDWEPADSPAQATADENGAFHIRGQTGWGRASGLAGPIRLPACLRFKVGHVRVQRAERGPADLLAQGFRGPYGFFCEVGLRVVEDHAFSGLSLTRTAWMSLNFGQREVFGMLRAVNDERRANLALEPLAPGLRAFPSFSGATDPQHEVEVAFDLRSDGWSCEAVTLGRGNRGRRSLSGKLSGRWRDLGLAEAPQEVWAWVHAGTWASGQGEGMIVARVDPR